MADLLNPPDSTLAFSCCLQQVKKINDYRNNETLQSYAKIMDIFIPDQTVSWCWYQLILALQSFILMVINFYLLANEVTRYGYIGVQKM